MIESSNKRHLILYAALVVSVAINVLQGARIYRLDNLSENNTEKATLTRGTALSSFSGTKRGGGPETVVFEDNVPTVLYVFSPSCMWCVKNSEAVNELASRTAGKVRFVGLSLSEEGLDQFVKSHGIQFPVYSSINESTISQYKLGSTPQTIVVSPEGKVIREWTGTYAGTNADSLKRFFDNPIIRN